MRDLAQRRAAGADPVEQPAGAAGCQGVERRRGRRLVGAPAAELLVGAAAEPVDQDEDDWEHARRLLNTNGGACAPPFVFIPAPLTPSGAEL